MAGNLTLEMIRKGVWEIGWGGVYLCAWNVITET